MKSKNGVLRKLLSDYTEYCCLCFEIFEENDCYTLQDEILFKTESAINLCEILSFILGEQVINTLSANTICKKCTETTISSYKFIKMCKNNVWSLAQNIISLESYVNNVPESNNTFKSLFLALNTVNNSVECLYDSKQHHKTQLSSLCKRFKHLQRTKCIKSVCNFLTIDIELEPEWNETIEFPELSISPIHNFQPKKRNKKRTKNVKMKPDMGQFSDNLHESDVEHNYRCKDCSKIYLSNVKLKQHYLCVHAPKEFQCSKCPKSFGTSLLLNRHIKDSHCIVVCSRCGKTYTNVHSLRYHEKSHSKSRLVCQSCGKVYKGKQAFKNHIEQKLCEASTKPSIEAKFECTYCQKKYTQKAALNVHVRLQHENGKGVICDWCGKKLSSASRLNDHILTHTKQKNFSCDTCGGKFVTKASLLYHTRTHTGVKPYKCDSCDMRFLSASRRSEHVKRQHGGLEECDICHSKFKGQTLLKKHRKRHFNVSSRLYHNLSK